MQAEDNIIDKKLNIKIRSTTRGKNVIITIKQDATKKIHQKIENCGARQNLKNQRIRKKKFGNWS